MIVPITAKAKVLIGVKAYCRETQVLIVVSPVSPYRCCPLESAGDELLRAISFARGACRRAKWQSRQQEKVSLCEINADASRFDGIPLSALQREETSSSAWVAMDRARLQTFRDWAAERTIFPSADR
jgi:hypothetical protein